MKQYDIINQCLEILKHAEMDLMEKLRIENLLIQMKMHLLVDIYKQEAMPEVFQMECFEDLLKQVNKVCGAGAAADEVKDLVERVKKMNAAMSEHINRNE